MQINLPKTSIIIGISSLQGVILTLLYASFEQQVWPSTDPVWFVALITFFISAPSLTLLSITDANIKSSGKLIIPFSLLLASLGAYIGLQQTPTDYVRNAGLIGIFVFTSLIASFKALMYIQQYSSKAAISYSRLFNLSWRNFIIFAECSVFVGVFFGILHLGAALFSVIGITVFETLLGKYWFIIPVLNMALGFSIILFRRIINTADVIAMILKTLVKFLLPAITIVSIGFLCTLPFTGLDALWNTGSGSILVMWLQALTLFFVNTVYQNETTDRPYHYLIHRLIFVGVALLPIYSVISAHGLYLRIEQYGLTEARCWGLLVWSFLTTFSIGYLVGIVRRRDRWLETLSVVNVGMGIVVMIAMLLVNSPILDFQRISANSQLARLFDGELSYNDFNYSQFGNTYGRHGYLKLQALKSTLENEAPDKITVINRFYESRLRKAEDKAPSQAESQADLETKITYWPNKSAFPAEFIDAVTQDATSSRFNQYQGKSFYLIAYDLNGDMVPEFVSIEERNHYTSAFLWQLNETEWSKNYMSVHNPSDNSVLKPLLENNQIQLVEPKWKPFQIGDLIFTVPAKHSQ